MGRLPFLAILLGVAGLIPFLLLGFGAVMPDAGGHRLPLLLDYGAVILSFLGGVHWGFALLAPAPLPGAARAAGDWTRAERARLLGGVSASLLGMLALVLQFWLPPAISLVILIAGFATMTVIEQRAVRHGWMPRHYMWLRWGLSIVVVLVLLAVLVMRLLGAGR